MRLNDNLFVVFEAVEGKEKKECFVYFTDKNKAPYFTGDPVKISNIKLKNGKKLVCWKAPIDVSVFDLKIPQDELKLPTTTIKIYKLWQEGNSIPDIATCWIAIKDNKAISVQSRSDMWRSEDYIYPDWLDSLRQKYSLVAA